MIHLQMTMTFLSSQRLQLSRHIRTKKDDMVVLSQGTMLFIEIEKAGTKGCFKIAWLVI